MQFFGVFAVLACLGCISPGYGSVCNRVTDIIILIESKLSDFPGDQHIVFRRHQSTAFDIVHRLPMKKGHARVTIAQFNSDKTKIEVIFASNNDSVGDAMIYHQEKAEVLDKIISIRPLLNSAPAERGGNLIGAMKLVSDAILPKILKKETDLDPASKNAQVIMVTIVSGYWYLPDVKELANVYVKLSKQGVLSYVAGYDMKDKPSESVLPLIVSKKQFLVLPKLYQSSAVAGHLTEAFEVCWKDGLCWPNNPCHYGCECIEDSSVEVGYKCISDGSFWLKPDCTKPTPLLYCKPDSMELRLPKRFVTELRSPPKGFDIFVGNSSRNEPDCMVKVIDHSSQDPGGDQRASAILQSERFYYLVIVDIVNNDCQSLFRIDPENDTLEIENVVFKSRRFISKQINMNIPVMRMRCIYPATISKLVHINVESYSGESARTDQLGDMVQEDGRVQEVISRATRLSNYRLDLFDRKRESSLEDPVKFLRTGGVGRDAQLVSIPLVEKRVNRSPRNLLKSVNWDCGPGYPCHCGPYEAGDPCHPKHRSTPKTSTPALMATETPSTAQEKTWTTAAKSTVVTAAEKSTIETLIATSKIITSAPATLMGATVYNSVIRMKLYEDKDFTKEIDPGGVQSGMMVFVSVGPDDVANPTTGVCPFVRECSVAIHSGPFLERPIKSGGTLPIIVNGCPVEDNAFGLRIMDNGSSRSASFSFISTPIKGIGTDSANHIRCNATVCDCSAGSCGWDCSKTHPRNRRSTTDEEFFAEVGILLWKSEFVL